MLHSALSLIHRLLRLIRSIKQKSAWCLKPTTKSFFLIFVLFSIYPFAIRSVIAQQSITSNLIPVKLNQSPFELALTNPFLKSYASTKTDTNSVRIPFNPTYFPLYSDSLSDATLPTFIRNQQQSQTKFSRIQQSGSISRGIIIGNTQDASVESGMDLRFEALLGDSIRVSASLTDQNTPIQPDGSSLQLREFDRILIQLQSTQTNASLGDIDLALPQHPYLQLNRRVMGAQANWNSSTSSTKNGYSSTAQGGLAALRGQYQISLIAAVEGFQGPYRLTNDQGEPFVIVLAGSESIFLNGQKLERGSDRDYTIDYSFGEINFTASRLIRASDRIRVEYQFLNQTYPELLIAAGYEHQKQDKWKLSYQIARSQAVVGATNTALLTDEERLLLQNAGDDLAQLRTERVQLADQGPSNAIRYSRLDTVINGQALRYFAFDPDGAFNVFFSRVSFGEGAYRRATNQPINGIVYEFVGQGRGDFSPFRQIIAPTAKTLQSVLFEWNPATSISIKNSVALSSFDQNRLSNIGDSNNNHLAGFQEITWQVGQLTSLEAIYQQSSSGFQSFDRIRDPEFERNWGGLVDNVFGERLTALKWNQKTNKGSDIIATYAQLEIGEELKNRWELAATFSEKWLSGESDFRYLSQNIAGRRQHWLFANADLVVGQFKLKQWQVQPLLTLSHENRAASFGISQSVNAANANLRGPSYFLEYGSGIKLISDRSDWQFTYAKREENVAFSDLIPENRRVANLYGFSQKLRQKYFRSEQRFSWFDIPNEPSFSIYSQQLATLANDMGNIRLAYEGESRLQGVLTEVYTFVGNQFGVYYWEDINGDGVEQLDEFFPERSPEEGTHILQVLPSEELAGITKVQLSARSSFSLNAILNKASSDKGLGIDFAWSQMDENTSSAVRQVLLLDQDLLLSDSLTLSGRQQSSLQTYWKGNEKLRELRFSMTQLQALRNRSSFNEQTMNRLYRLSAEINATEKIRVTTEASYEKRQNETATLLNRQLDLRIFSINSELVQAMSTRFRRSLLLEYSQGSGRNGTNFFIYSLKSGINAIVKGGPLNVDVGLNHTSLNGIFSPLANFELTGGQGVGTQFRADFRYGRALGRGIKADINWSVRTRANDQILQTARFTLNSSF